MMQGNINFQDFLENMEFIKKLYDFVRIVDPVAKKVSQLEGNNLENTDAICYDFWKEGRSCENCISARALLDEETHIKLEYNGERVYMITAIPVRFNDKSIVLELLKDVTNNSVLLDVEGKSIDDISNALKIKNALIIKDSLTGVYNRRFIDERLPYEILESFIAGKPLSVIITDIDYFKRINDAYGHLAGDEAIRVLSDKIQYCLRKEDWVSRYGGDEFVIFLKNTDLNLANKIVERIKNTVENTCIYYENHCIQITVSFGLVTLKDKKSTLDELLKQADNNLYEAKKEENKGIVASYM